MCFPISVWPVALKTFNVSSAVGIRVQTPRGRSPGEVRCAHDTAYNAQRTDPPYDREHGTRSPARIAHGGSGADALTADPDRSVCCAPPARGTVVLGLPARAAPNASRRTARRRTPAGSGTGTGAPPSSLPCLRPASSAHLSSRRRPSPGGGEGVGALHAHSLVATRMPAVSVTGRMRGAITYCVKMDVLIAARLPPESSTITMRLLALGVALTASAAT